MFPPFYVRNLHGRRRMTGRVEILPSQYDETIAELPEARLMYIDDDDGEVITVGSAHELGDRLKEQAPPSAYSYKGEDLKEHTVHIFDISSSEAVVAKWKSIAAVEPREVQEQELRHRSETTDDFRSNTELSPPPISLPFSSKKGTAIALTSRAGQSSQIPDQRPAHFRKAWIEGLPASVSTVSDKSQGQSTLTLEGYKQAIADGDHLKSQLRDYAKKYRYTIPEVDYLPATHGSYQNRWASYQSPSSWGSHLLNAKSGSTVLADTSKVSENDDVQDKGKAKVMDAPEPTESACDQGSLQSTAGSQSFLEAFEAELAKHMSEDNSKETIASTQKAAPPANPASSSSPSYTTVTAPQGVDDIALQAIGTFAGIVGGLGLELTKRVPGLQDKARDLGYNVSEFVDKAVTEAILSSNGQATEGLCKVLQRTSDASLYAAEQTRQADVKVVKDLFTGLTNVVGEIGKSVWGGLEREITESTISTATEATVTEEGEGQVKPLAKASTTSKNIPPTQQTVEFSCSRQDCLHKDVSRPIVFPDLMHLNRHNLFYHSDRISPRSETKLPGAVTQLVEDGLSFHWPVDVSSKAYGSAATSSHKLPPKNRTRNASFNDASSRLAQPFMPCAPGIAMHELSTTDCVGSSDGLSNIKRDPVPKPEKVSHHPLSNSASVPVFNATILDQEDGDPEFSARYPSLMSNKGLQSDDRSGRSQLKNSSYLRDMIPEKEIARYPPVSEIEKSVPRYRHSMRESAKLHEYQPYSRIHSPWVSRPQPKDLPKGWSLFNGAPKSSKKDSYVSRQVPGAWPEVSSEPSKAKLQDAVKPAEESSGAFFERMTGRRAAAMDDSMIEDKGENDATNLRRAHTTACSKRYSQLEADFDARLASPFDPLADLSRSFGLAETQVDERKDEDKNDEKTQTAGNAAPSADGNNAIKDSEPFKGFSVTQYGSRTEPVWQYMVPPREKPAPPVFAGSRRPYSTHFTGAGRNSAMNNLIAPDSQSRTAGQQRFLRPRPYSVIDTNVRFPRSHRPAPAIPVATSTSSALPIEAAAPPDNTRSTGRTISARPSLPILSNTLYEGYGVNRLPRRETANTAGSVIPPNNPPTTDRIQLCVQHLHDLGYSKISDMGPRFIPRTEQSINERLRIYAEAANGDVADAIDMLEEEKKAWKGIRKA